MTRMLCTLLLVALAACQPHYDGLQIRYLTSDGELEGGHLEIIEGKAVLIDVKPLSDNPFEDYERFDLVELESFQESILLVAPASEVDQFVLIGRSVGSTRIRVSINDVEQDSIDAEVEPQIGGGP